MEQSFWIKLRYSADNDNDSDDFGRNLIKPRVHLKFSKTFGGIVTSPKVASPSAYDWKLIGYRPLEWILSGDINYWLKISIKSIEIPDEREKNLDDDERESLKGLIVQDFSFNICYSSCTLNQRSQLCGSIIASHAGYNAPKDFVTDFIIKTHIATVLFSAPAGSSFSLTWKQLLVHQAKVEISSNNISQSDASQFTCGEQLQPTYQAKYLKVPAENESDELFDIAQSFANMVSWRDMRRYRYKSGYANNLKCRWSIVRPKFTGISLKVISLDLEEHINCNYDYIAYSIGDIDFKDGQIRYLCEEYFQHLYFADGNYIKLCKHKDIGFEETYRNGEIIYIYFITDRNRSGKGFVIEYKLACLSFDYIFTSMGILDEIVHSPNYPDKYPANLTCNWSIVLESNRAILAKFVDMDIEEAVSCAKDSITLQEGYMAVDDPNKRLCGKQSDWNETFTSGRVFISFITDASVNKKGFALRLMEQIHDCSSDRLTINEGDWPKVLHSPNFPKLSPNSLDCQWVINAPVGHRIQFSVDPLTFDLQDTSGNNSYALFSKHLYRCIDDYLEVRDGPSKNSPLFGIYCRREPPSTIFSSGSYLYIRYRTDSYIESTGFNSTYEIATCGGTVVLATNKTSFIRSPNFPDPYPSKVECTCFAHLWLTYKENCSADSITMREHNATGEYILKPTCASITVIGKFFQTRRNIMSVFFQSQNNQARSSRMFCLQRKCGFEIVFKPSQIDHLMPQIACDWKFKAGIGYRYVLDFSFTKHQNFYQTAFDQTGCYPDVVVRNGVHDLPYFYGLNRHNFCENKTRFISSADVLSLTYDDRMTHFAKRELFTSNRNSERIYAPFRIEYLKVPQDYDSNSCMYHITTNLTIIINETDNLEYSIRFNPKG
ncbi:unnamed protein product [Dracunculus medinensis]|uniref:CUB domain-containing protein n=1 Tax=Dracunculus medinensis TaxID=318479 RepID=A0A158Q6J5_DRAME|nr:unnamed protein product [Dracunculus medinensis]